MRWKAAVEAEEAAAALGFGRTKFYELIARGTIESVRIGACRRVPVSALEDFVTRLRSQDAI